MKKLTTLLSLLLLHLVVSAQYDVIIRNGKIIDGSGNSWYYADIAVKDGKIVAIQKALAGTAAKIIDARISLIASG